MNPTPFETMVLGMEHLQQPARALWGRRDITGLVVLKNPISGALEMVVTGPERTHKNARDLAKRIKAISYSIK